MSRAQHSTAILGLAAMAMACVLIGSAVAASAPAAAPTAVPLPPAAAPLPPAAAPSLPAYGAPAATPTGPRVVALAAPTPTGPRTILPVAPTPTGAHTPTAPAASPTAPPMGSAGAGALPSATPTATPLHDGVLVTILGIKATNEATPFIDAALQPISRELARSSFNSFREDVSDRKRILIQGETTVPMEEGYALRVHVEKDSGEVVQLVLSWLRTDIGSDGRAQTRVLQRMQIALRKGRYFLSGGWQMKDGARWAAISAQ